MNKHFWASFWAPITVLGLIGVYFAILPIAPTVALVIALAGVALGSFDLFKETVASIREGKFALDYIAIAAVILGVVTGEYVAALVIALMLATGQGLEQYGFEKARASLTALTDRIPNEVVLWRNGQAGERAARSAVTVGAEILVRKGEVVPLDGELVSERGVLDESSLTGEPYLSDKVTGDLVRSGTVNTGDVMVVRVTKRDEDSTYRKIVALVEEAQVEKAPMVRLADKYSLWFTALTTTIAVAAFITTGSWERVLSVLVVATPCPLILATPIALFGGLSASAKQRILVKRIASLEVLSRVTDIIFDKTGTITLGTPQVNRVETAIASSTNEVLQVAEALERNSLHPIAKAIVQAAQVATIERVPVAAVREVIGQGISGQVNGREYTIKRAQTESFSQSVEVWQGDTLFGRIFFADILKTDSHRVLEQLKQNRLSLHLFTGDRAEPAARMVAQLGLVGKEIAVRARCTPEDKKNGVAELKTRGAVTAMVGDGINDPPALALADVGLVFSNEEQTAASEAADIVFLGGDLSQVVRVMNISQRTVRIAVQSILIGIGASVVAMIFAALGYITPVTGALIQELIDIVAIFNALRASR